jgi:sensor histidine kinase YesM
MKNALDLPKNTSPTHGALDKVNRDSLKIQFSKVSFFVKENWIWIVAGLTVLSLFHSFWYFQREMGSERFLRLHSSCWEGLIKNKNQVYAASYNIGKNIGFWGTILLKSRSGFFSILGLTILLCEFNYQILFKNLFVEEGRKGKFFYLVILVFFYGFIYLLLNAIIDPKLSPIGFPKFFTNFWLISMVVYSYFAYASESYNKIRELALQKTKAELVALKAQINPHFLFNVLNNLYGQAIVEDSPKTASGIERLSRIMRHVVEETKTERSPIEKELKFVEDFIELQKMRIPDRPNIKLNTDIFWDGESANIAPLLVIPFIENAFKYGISVTNESFFEMKLRVENKVLLFESRNSIIKKTDKLEIGTGTGLENTRRRLNLYYHGRHSLAINTENEVFEVKMQVKL